MHVGDLSLEDLDIRKLGEDAADGLGDFGRAQPGRRDLVQEGLKEVMVAAIEQGDIDLPYTAQRLRCRKPAESAADNQHACHGTNLTDTCIVVADWLY